MCAFPIHVVVKSILTIYILNLLQLPRVGRCIHFLAGCVSIGCFMNMASEAFPYETRSF
jgi:hypothetical protein